MKNKFKLIYILSFFLVISLSSLYIFQIINYTKESYLAQNYQNERDTIFREALSYSSFASPSLYKIEKVAESMDFIQVGEINYIEVPGREVVVR